MIVSRQQASRKYNLERSSLASYSTSLFEPVNLISGNKSLGHFLSKYNYSATPSPAFASPPEQFYFERDWTIEEYGRPGNCSAIMIESPARELTNVPRLYVYARSLAYALLEYLSEIVPSSTSQQCSSSGRRRLQIYMFLLLLFHMFSFIWNEKNYFFHSNKYK